MRKRLSNGKKPVIHHFYASSEAASTLLACAPCVESHARKNSTMLTVEAIARDIDAATRSCAQASLARRSSGSQLLRVS